MNNNESSKFAKLSWLLSRRLTTADEARRLILIEPFTKKRESERKDIEDISFMISLIFYKHYGADYYDDD